MDSKVPPITYAYAPDGSVLANGVEVTDAQAWLRLSARSADDARQLMVRVRLVADANGRLHPVPTEIALPGDRPEDGTIAVGEGSGSLAAMLVAAIEAEVERRLAHVVTRRLVTVPSERWRKSSPQPAVGGMPLERELALRRRS